MQLHRDSEASADTKRPDPAPAEGEFALNPAFNSRTAMNALLIPFRAPHHARRCCGLASSTFGEVTTNFPPLHSPTRHTGTSTD